MLADFCREKLCADVCWHTTIPLDLSPTYIRSFMPSQSEHGLLPIFVRPHLITLCRPAFCKGAEFAFSSFISSNITRVWSCVLIFLVSFSFDSGFSHLHAFSSISIKRHPSTVPPLFLSSSSISSFFFPFPPFRAPKLAISNLFSVSLTQICALIF